MLLVIIIVEFLLLFGGLAYFICKGKKRSALIAGFICLILNTWAVSFFVTIGVGYSRDAERRSLRKIKEAIQQYHEESVVNAIDTTLETPPGNEKWRFLGTRMTNNLENEIKMKSANKEGLDGRQSPPTQP